MNTTRRKFNQLIAGLLAAPAVAVAAPQPAEPLTLDKLVKAKAILDAQDDHPIEILRRELIEAMPGWDVRIDYQMKSFAYEVSCTRADPQGDPGGYYWISDLIDVDFAESQKKRAALVKTMAIRAARTPMGLA